MQSLQRITNRSLFAAFGTWRDWAKQQAELKKKLQGAVCKLTHQQLAAAWQAWRERAGYKAGVKGRMQAGTLSCVVHAVQYGVVQHNG